MMKEFAVVQNHSQLPALTVSLQELENARSDFWDAKPEATNSSPRFPKGHSLVEILHAPCEKLARQFYQQRIVYVQSNETLLLRFAYDYEVDLDRISSPLELLGWTLHLCGKNWMTTEHLHYFIEAVCQIKDFKVHMH